MIYRHGKSGIIIEPQRYPDHVWDMMMCHLLLFERHNQRLFRLEFHRKFRCAACNKQQLNWPRDKLKICKGCNMARYCSKKCQKYDWVRNKHRLICRGLIACLK